MPTATTRRPSPLARFTAAAVASGITARSKSIRWSSTRSTFTGRNVPIPTWSVTRATVTPRAAASASIASVKCRPAVGAAIAPGSRAKTVW